MKRTQLIHLGLLILTASLQSFAGFGLSVPRIREENERFIQAILAEQERILQLRRIEQDYRAQIAAIDEDVAAIIALLAERGALIAAIEAMDMGDNTSDEEISEEE